MSFLWLSYRVYTRDLSAYEISCYKLHYLYSSTTLSVQFFHSLRLSVSCVAGARYSWRRDEYRLLIVGVMTTKQQSCSSFLSPSSSSSYHYCYLWSLITVCCILSQCCHQVVRADAAAAAAADDDDDGGVVKGKSQARFPFKRVNENRKKRKQPIMVSTASTEHSYWLKFSRNKRKRQPIGMLGRSSGNHDCLRFLRFSFTQRTQRKRLRLNGNRASVWWWFRSAAAHAADREINKAN